MDKEQEVKISKEQLKEIIVEALNEHHEKLNKVSEPKIGDILFDLDVRSTFKNLIKYMLLFVLLAMATGIFCSVVMYDYGTLFISWNLKDIVKTVSTAAINILVCSIFLIPAIWIYDMLVVRYTKFTRLYSIAIILSTINSFEPFGFSIIDIVNKFL